MNYNTFSFQKYKNTIRLFLKFFKKIFVYLFSILFFSGLFLNAQQTNIYLSEPTNETTILLNEVTLQWYESADVDGIAAYEIDLNGSTYTIGNTNGFVDVTNGIIGYWKFNETSGLTAADSSGFGRDGTLDSGAVFASNNHCGSPITTVQFTRTNAVGVGTIGIENQFSWATWIYLPSVGNNTTNINFFMASGPGGVNKGIRFFTYGYDHAWAGSIRLEIADASGGLGQWDIFQTASNSFTYDDWHHVAVTYDQVNSNCVLYIDGLETSNELYNHWNGENFADVSNLNIWFGNARGAITNDIYGYDGEMDNVRMYNRVLTSAEVASIYLYSSSCNLPNPATNLYLTDLLAGTYSWKVRYWDGSGTPGIWSASWNFYITNVPCNTFHVDTTGNDTTGDGSIGSPFLTIQKAFDSLTAPLVTNSVCGAFYIYVHPGNFAPAQLSTSYATATDPVILTSWDPADKAVITGGAQMRIRDEYLTISNIIISNLTGYGVWVDGANGGKNLTIIDSELVNNNLDGILVNGVGGSNVIIINNTISDNGENGIVLDSGEQDNIIISNNIILQHSKKGIKISGANNKIYRNLIISNTEDGLYLNSDALNCDFKLYLSPIQKAKQPLCENINSRLASSYPLVKNYYSGIHTSCS